MSKLYLFLIVSLFFNVDNIYSQSGTFDFTGAEVISSGGANITQTVSTVLLTLVSTGSTNSLALDVNVSSYGIGMSGTAVLMATATTSLTFTFDHSVNISTMRVADYSGGNNPNLHFLASNSAPKDIIINGLSGSTINFGTSFTGITSITLTQNGGGNFQLYIDDIVMDAALPVELTSFTAQQNENMVTLNWRTATEVKNYGFEVEKSKVKSQNSNVDVSWEKIGFVQGNGNSNSPKEYSFVDKTVSVGKYSYRLKQIDFDGQFEYSSIVDVQLAAPLTFALKQNYPNPFNPSTVISWQLAVGTHVVLKVYDVLGNEVAVLVNGLQPAGDYEIPFNGEKLNSGVYIYKLQTSDGFTAIKKLMLVK